ncbi:MAG: dockerin type I domain-containing protein, partial [Verrucomicrobiota bacterium]|nr:dockerin type I domain-containing protein [Verrucomicrobiota bacterium]
VAPQTQLTLQGGSNNRYLGANANLNIASNATVNLNFSGTLASFGTLLVDGVAQPPGVYGPPGSGAPHQLAQLTGSGTAQALLPVAVSRKTHGGAGSFDIFLPLTGTPAIECRSGGAGGNHQIVVTFLNTVTFNSASVTAGSGSVVSANANGALITLNLTGVANQQTTTVTLFGVNDGTNMGNVAIPLSVLVGDTNGDGIVNSGDALQTRNRSGQATDPTNFRSDVNLDGIVNSGDTTVVRSRSGTSLP